ncbi:cystine/glutamate transporter-like isoform X4 [Scophthalmus maximus]|uniref:cystine/glutamate transporter-like isoform X4 n=1 Tax=Scophthalmus maximus TaxID=52904 RepID=UPI001FA8BFC8|nr:cystine/glutamate transporter-like isoform X4 [Scophthalmus maximus]
MRVVMFLLGRGVVLRRAGHHFHQIGGPIHLPAGDAGAAAGLRVPLGGLLLHPAGREFLRVPGVRPLRGGSVLHTVRSSRGAAPSRQHPRTFVTAVNCWSVTLASRTQVTMTFVKLFALVLIIVPGLIALADGKTENFQKGFEVDALTLDRLPLAFYNGLYAYGGWFYLNCVTEEVINPKRNIPLAVVFSMVTVTVLYVLVNVAYYTMMMPAELLLSDAVAVTFANRAFQAIAPVIPVLVALSCLGALNGGIFGSPRMQFVGGREGHWPRIFSMIHIRRRTPLPAVMLQYPLVVVMLLKGEIYKLVNFASFPRWFFIALATLGMLIHRYRFPLHPRPFKVPVAVAVTVTVVCFFIVGLSLYSDPWSTGCSCALTLSGVPVYYVTVYRFLLPKRFRRIFNYFSEQLQILLEVAQQEVQTY